MAVNASKVFQKGKKMAKDLKGDIKSGPFKKLADDKQTNVIEKMLPYRTKGWVNAALVGGATIAVGAQGLSDVSNMKKSRGLGYISASPLANQVGVSPVRHGDDFIKGVPKKATRSWANSVTFRPDEGHIFDSFNEDGVGGDLVFALNNLR